MKKRFNKNLAMTAEYERSFKSSNKSWIYDGLFGEGDKLTKKVPVVFHNLRGYESHLIMQEIGTFDVKISFIPNGLEKYMAFTINRNLGFIYSMQFVNSSLDALVKNF